MAADRNVTLTRPSVVDVLESELLMASCDTSILYAFWMAERSALSEVISN